MVINQTTPSFDEYCGLDQAADSSNKTIAIIILATGLIITAAIAYNMYNKHKILFESIG